MPDPINLAVDLPYYTLAFLGGYLLGSIPFGFLLTRLCGLGDIRTIGSGNIGATNVLRTGNTRLALATLILDGGKGALAVFLAGHYGPDIMILGAAGAFIGHLFPVWLKFKGGKGVATFVGIMLALHWPVGLMAVGSWMLTAALFRYSSVAALLAVILTPVSFWLIGYFQLAELAFMMAILVVFRHHENIRRLYAGTESKIGTP